MYTEPINDCIIICGKIDNTGDEIPILVVYSEDLTLTELDALQVEILLMLRSPSNIPMSRFDVIRNSGIIEFKATTVG